MYIFFYLLWHISTMAVSPAFWLVNSLSVFSPCRRGPAHGSSEEKCFPPFCRKLKKNKSLLCWSRSSPHRQDNNLACRFGRRHAIRPRPPRLTGQSKRSVQYSRDTRASSASAGAKDKNFYRRHFDSQTQNHKYKGVTKNFTDKWFSHGAETDSASVSRWQKCKKIVTSIWNKLVQRIITKSSGHSFIWIQKW